MGEIPKQEKVLQNKAKVDTRYFNPKRKERGHN
jgi:hypothetical protein